jgi:uncharacterized damage-inducible protein DinB
MLERISDEGFAAVTLLKNGQPSNGRNVAKVFAHMLGVRIAQIPKAFHDELKMLELGEAPSRDTLNHAFQVRDTLVQAFRVSGRAFEALLPLALTRNRSVKNPKRTGMLLFAYLIAYESHHRGQIMLVLKQSGTRIREEHPFGMWAMWFDPASTEKNT